MINNIQGLRAIAVLFVLFVHIGLVEKKYSLLPILPDIVQFGMSGVDIFFVISGFIMMTITMRTQYSVKNALTFLSARIIRIYPIYWFYSLLVLVVYLVNSHWVNSGAEVNIVDSFLLIPQNHLPLLAVGWTLVHEVYFYTGFFILLLFLRSHKSMFMAVLMWGIAVVFTNLLMTFSDPFLNIIFHPLSIEFIAGSVVAYVMNSSIAVGHVLRWKLIAGVAVLLLPISYFVYDSHFHADPVGWWRVGLFGIPATLLLIAFVKLEKGGVVFSSWWVSIGDRSYTIYLSHVLVINAVGRVWQLFEFENRSMSLLFIVILTVSTLLFAKYAYEWVEVPMIKRLKALKGRV